MAWMPLGWLRDAVRSAWELPLGLKAEILGLLFLWMVSIILGMIWLRSPAAPSLDDQEPRGGGKH